MTLTCKHCGGALELEGQSYGPETAHESYRCANCGATGTYRFGEGGEHMSGCVTDR